MRHFLVLAVLPLAGCMYTPDSKCAAAIERYARAQEQVAREIAESNNAMKATASAMNAAAAREDSRIATNKKMAEQMERWKCTPSGLPMTPAPLPTPGYMGDD